MTKIELLIQRLEFRDASRSPKNQPYSTSYPHCSTPYIPENQPCTVLVHAPSQAQHSVTSNSCSGANLKVASYVVKITVVESRGHDNCGGVNN